jgi:hypothetical protein
VVSSPLTRSSYHAGEVQRLILEHPRSDQTVQHLHLGVLDALTR